MGLTTCRDLPYPDPTDQVNQLRLQLQALAEAIDADLCDVFGASLWDTGDMKMTIETTPLPGWVMMGTSIPNANVGETAALFAKAPASWKSGSTLNLPSMTNRVPMGGGTLGAVGGASSISLVAANLPPHAHTVNITSGTESAGHTHSIAHDHPNFNTNTSSYTIGPLVIDFEIPARANATLGGNGSLMRSNNSGTEQNLHILSATNSEAHTHSVSINVPAYSGSSGGVSNTHTHSVNGGTGNGPGSSQAIDITPAHLRLNFMIKL